jgi:FKBP-type peptidyl-prolyl cis-trans isomerase FklB
MLIKGWTEALQLMKPGAKWQLFVPPDLAYGERGASAQIGPNATLIFEMELVSFKAPPPPSHRPDHPTGHQRHHQSSVQGGTRKGREDPDPQAEDVEREQKIEAEKRKKLEPAEKK